MDKTDWIKIIDILIPSISWPCFFLILFFLIKKYIPLIGKIRVNDIEVEFKQSILDIRQNREQYISIKPDSSDKKYITESMLKLAEKSPYALIIQAYSIAEDNILALAKEYGKKEYLNVLAALQDLTDRKNLSQNINDLFFRIYAVKERLIYTEERVNTKELSLEIADLILGIANDVKCDLEEKKEI